MNNQRIAEIKARRAAATPGPWNEVRRTDGRLYFGTRRKPIADICNLYGAESEANLQFIAHAQDDVGFLLAELEAECREAAILRDAMRKVGALCLKGPGYGINAGRFAVEVAKVVDEVFPVEPRSATHDRARPRVLDGHAGEGAGCARGGSRR